MTHKKHITNEEADFIISKALIEGDTPKMSDEIFDKLWDNAQKQPQKNRSIRLRFYAIAASIALMVSFTGVWFYNESQNYMVQQYEQSTLALNKVSKYLNMGLSKLDHVDQYQKAVQHLEVLNKPQKEVDKLEYINKLPIIIE